MKSKIFKNLNSYASYCLTSSCFLVFFFVLLRTLLDVSSIVDQSALYLDFRRILFWSWFLCAGVDEPSNLSTAVRSTLLPIRSGVRQSSACLLSIRGNDTLCKAKALRIWTAERVSGPLMAFFSLVQGTEMYNTFLRYPFENEISCFHVFSHVTNSQAIGCEDRWRMRDFMLNVSLQLTCNHA